MSEETLPLEAEPQAEPKAKAQPKAEPKARIEKVKEPTVEELPFDEFIGSHYIPALSKAFQAAGITDLILEFDASDSQPKLLGRWQQNLRQFAVYFSKKDINGQKAFSCADGGLLPSTIEPFLIDERKATLDLLVFGIMQRLNGQKWLAAN